MKILYSDQHIVICVKEPGVLSQGDEKGTESMVDMLKCKFNEEIYPVHRLDRNVGGVMVFAKTKESAKQLSKIVADKENFTKEYLAIVHGETDEAGIYKDLIYKSSRENKAFVVKKERKGVKEGVLEFSRLNVNKTSSGCYSLIKVKLHTGRFHQIRVQFASRKKPLAGDGKYGSRDNKCDVALWSYRIGLDHPKSNEKLNFTSVPDTNSYPWNLFSEDIEGLK